tara:strand:- start:267 stop:911 length:645 start_codon:yes stop_codon:yes gene_type:complete
LSVSFGKKVLPTKIELIRLKKSLKVSRTIHKILEDKRDVLLRRLDEMIDEATKARDETGKPLSDAYLALYDAYLEMGPINLESTASTTPISMEVDVNVRRVVDVDVPTLQMKGKDEGLTYGFADTTSALDKATKLMRQVLPTIGRAAELENAIFRLAAELEKTQRLINALEYIIIPGYVESIKYITSTLEEREREAFVKLKHVKKVIEMRQGGI